MARTITVYNGVTCWVDIDQVLSLTGETVTETNMAVAQGILSVITEVDPELLPTDLRDSDRRKLEDMLSYQAPWVAKRVDLFAEVDVSRVSQDGLSVDYASQYSTKLAPLAMMCFQRLSWNRRGIKTKKRGRRFSDIPDVQAAVLRGEVDDPTGTTGTIGRPFS